MILRVTLLTVFLAFGLAAYAICAPKRNKYESAPYTVAESDGAFEIRDYPALPLASTPVNQPNRSGEDQGFMQLFRYISGRNEEAQKIAMTTPVFMSEEAMSFVLPPDVAQAGAPEPTASSVKLEAFERGRYATYRFTGLSRDKRTEAAEAKLRQWMSDRGLTAAGDALFAYYDPPMTFPPLRRNEVLIRVR